MSREMSNESEGWQAGNPSLELRRTGRRAFYVMDFLDVVDFLDLADGMDGWRGGKHTGDILATH